MVPSVPITPMAEFLVAETAALAPGSITPYHGISNTFRDSSMARAEAVLQAIIIAFISFVSKNLTD